VIAPAEFEAAPPDFNPAGRTPNPSRPMVSPLLNWLKRPRARSRKIFREEEIIMRLNILCVSAALSLSTMSGIALADAEAGKASAEKVCAGCHGAKGISGGDMFPNLAGQKKGYLVGALKAYRDKTRNAPIMNGMAASLSDQQIDDVAAYYSGLKGE
jgi:cytochrome c553